MTRFLSTVLVITFAILAGDNTAIAQAPAADRPKLISPIRGAAELGYTNAVRKREGNFVIATFKVKNLATAPIAGLRVEEFWYDKGGEIVGGSEPFRYRKPLMPNEVIEITMKVQPNPKMQRSQMKFSHGDGKNDTIKPKLMPKL